MLLKCYNYDSTGIQTSQETTLNKGTMKGFMKELAFEPHLKKTYLSQQVVKWIPHGNQPEPSHRHRWAVECGVVTSESVEEDSARKCSGMCSWQAKVGTGHRYRFWISFHSREYVITEGSWEGTFCVFWTYLRRENEGWINVEESEGSNSL